MSQTLLHQLLHDYGDLFVFALLTLECLGLPLPGETVMIAASFYAARSHNLALVPLLAAACAGAILGGILGYAIGRRYGSPLLARYGARIGITEDRRLLAHYLMERNGAALIFFGRFFAVIRPIENLLAGVTGMRWRKFLVFNALGGAAWTGFYCIGVYWFGSALTTLAGRAAAFAGIGTAIALIAGFFLVRHHEARLIAAASPTGPTPSPPAAPPPRRSRPRRRHS